MLKAIRSLKGVSPQDKFRQIRSARITRKARINLTISYIRAHLNIRVTRALGKRPAHANACLVLLALNKCY